MSPHTTTFERHIDIAAPPARIWRALCIPEEVAQWDTGVQFPIDAPPDYPQPGQRVRWRTTGSILRTLVDAPQEVVPERRLRSSLSLGPARYDETYTIQTTPKVSADTTEHCLLHMTMSLWVVFVPGRRLAFEYFATTTPATMETALTAIRAHCETPDRSTDSRI